MKRIQILVALLLFAWTMNAQTALDEAKKKIVNENYKEAKSLLGKYIAGEKDPNKQAEAYFWLGECDYLNFVDENPSKAIDQAREQYNKGLVLSKSNPQCLVGMGKLLLDKKNEKEALKTFDQAIRSSKAKPYREGSPEIFMLIGDAYLNCTQKNIEQADANYTRARDIEPKFSTVWIKMGDAKLAKGDAGGAMSAFETASQKDPKNPEVYLKRALIWQRATKLDLAIKECEDGIKIDADYAPLYKLLAELHYANGNFDKVTTDLDRYLSKTKIEDPDARLRFIKFLTYSAKDYTRAIAEANKFAATSAKDYPTVYRWLAWASFEKALALEKDKKPGEYGDDWKMLMQQSNDASKKLIDMLKATPDRLVDYDYNYAAMSAQKLGNLEEAMKMYGDVMKLDTSRTCDIYSSMMKANYDQKNIKEGLALLDEKVLKGCKANYSDYFLGMYYSNAVTREYERAIKYADKYIQIVPNGPDGYYYKGLSESQIDSIEPFKWMAKETYEKLISLYEAKIDHARAKGYIATAYNYVGIYYGAQQDLVKAKEYFQKTLAIDPANKQALLMMEQMGGK